MFIVLKDNKYIIAWCLWVWIGRCDGNFFHTPSVFEFYTKNINSSFGYSLAYQAENKLVVGAPHVDFIGGVFKCPLSDVATTKSRPCDEMFTNKKDFFGEYDRSSNDQNFCLGASIAVTEDYIFTCAPLRTVKQKKRSTSVYNVNGTCYVHNETGTRKTSIKYDYVSNILGWSTFVDPKNDVILISKSSPDSHILCGSARRPLDEPTVVTNTNNERVASAMDKGRAYTSGVFFKGYGTMFAFSLERKMRQGAVAFLVREENKSDGGKLELFVVSNGLVYIQDDHKHGGSMFGAALHAAHLTKDHYSELLVGAPAYTSHRASYETGAVIIYVGGGTPHNTTRNGVITNYQLCITHNKDGSRFGAAIASSDLDGDNLSEIFVSAPYEDGVNGAVYIISGFELNGLLKESINYVYVTNLQNIQRIAASKYKSFGFSLQPILNFNNNGGDVLAVGAPFSDRVLIYRSIPAINVTISAKLKGVESVREQDKNFTITVTVSVAYPLNTKNISSELSVTTNIFGMPAKIQDPKNYKIKLSHPNESITNFTKDILVLLSDEEPGFYKFHARVETDNETFIHEDFDDSLVTISQNSETEAKLYVTRRCKGNECEPRLLMEYDWYGRTKMDMKEYELGSSMFEALGIIVKNKGNTSYEACAKIKVKGAHVAVLNCEQPDKVWYICSFLEIKRHSEKIIDIHFNMTRNTNRDKALEVQVRLFNKCMTGNATAESTTIFVPYTLNTTDINLSGLTFDRNVTDLEISASTNMTIAVPETYKITNQGLVKWEGVYALVTLEKKPYVKDYTVSVAGSMGCIRVVENGDHLYNCTLNLNPKSTVNILTEINILKDEIEKNLNDTKIQLSSVLKVYLEPTSIVKELKLVTRVLYKKDLSYGQNKILISIIAALIAIIVLAIFVYILYKFGFFKREEKTKTIAIKAEIRRLSMRRPTYRESYDSSPDYEPIEVRPISER